MAGGEEKARARGIWRGDPRSGGLSGKCFEAASARVGMSGAANNLSLCG